MLAPPRASLTLLVSICAWQAGCAICANSHDCSYPAYGGVIQREERVHGRVGSLYGSQPVFVPGGPTVQQAPAPASPDASPLPDASMPEPAPPETTPPETTPSPSDRRKELPQPPRLDELQDNFDAPPIPDGDVL